MKERLLTDGELAKARNCKDCVFTVEDWGECGLCSNFNQCRGISKAQDAKTRRETLKEVGEWLEKNRLVSFIPECGADFCFLATEGFPNEVPEPEGGIGNCRQRERCRLWNAAILAYQDYLAKLKSGEMPE